MLKFSALPILIALVLGYFFPYSALALSPFAIIVLFLMMTLAAMEFDWSRLKVLVSYWKELAAGLFFLFLFFPLMQWFLARLLIKEESLFYGTMLASVCPVAIVAPSFTKLHKHDEDLSFIFMILSMIFFPLAVFMVLNVTHQTLHMRPIIIDMLLLIFPPLILGAILKKLDHHFLQYKISEGWKKIAVFTNMLFIAFLAFIYLGASVSRLNLTYTPKLELLAVLLVLFFQDFAVYFLARFFMRPLFPLHRSHALEISVSMKNVALAGAILLIYDPKASLAGALGFFVHALFFNFLTFTRPKT